jgi:hypothetical protein
MFLRLSANRSLALKVPVFASSGQRPAPESRVRFLDGSFQAQFAESNRILKFLDNRLQPLHHAFRLCEDFSIEIPALQPAHGRKEQAAGVKHHDQSLFLDGLGVVQRIFIERETPTAGIVSDHAADEARQIDGGTIAPTCGWIDQPRDFVSGEQDMIVMNIAQTGLNGKLQTRVPFKDRFHSWGDFPEHAQRLFAEQPKRIARRGGDGLF